MSPFTIPKTTWSQTKNQRSSSGLPETRLRAGPAHTLILSANPPLNHCYKTHQIPLGQDTQFLKGTMCQLCPLLPGKSVKLFFTTSPKTLRFNLVYRGWDVGINDNASLAWGRNRRLRNFYLFTSSLIALKNSDRGAIPGKKSITWVIIA